MAAAGPFTEPNMAGNGWKNHRKFHGFSCKAGTDRCKRAQGVFDAWQVHWVCGKPRRFIGGFSWEDDFG